MVMGQLTISVNACLISMPQCQEIVQAKLYARIGNHEVCTKVVKTDKNKQFTWDQKLLLKFSQESVLFLWLVDELRQGESMVIGECRINLEVIDRQKVQLFLFWNQKETAIVEATLVLDKRGNTYIAPEKRTKKLFLKFLIKEAILLKDTELIGSMKPAVKIRVGTVAHETANSKGRTPNWNQSIVFQNVNNYDQIYFTVVDKEMLGDDDLIGTFSTTVEKLKDERVYDMDLLSGGKRVGSLTFSVKQYYQ